MARDTANVRLEGARELRRAFKRLEPEVDKQVRGELRDVARRVLAEAEVPRKTGALAASIRPVVTLRGIALRSKLPYAGVIHWGGQIAPRGTLIQIEKTEFLSRPLERQTDRIVEEIADAFDRGAKRAGWT